MAYFLLLPLLALWLLALLVGSRLLRRTRLRWLSAYGWWVAAGSVVGFFLAAAAWVGILYGVLHTPLPAALRLPQQLTIMGVALLGPFVASAIGVALGSVGGLLLAWRTRPRRRPA